MLRRFILVLIICFTFTASSAAADETYRIQYVIDGDTLVLGEGSTVRLIGVDTPEINDETGRNLWTAKKTSQNLSVINAFAHKAKTFSETWVQGQRVYLEFDPANAKDNHFDDYDRLLAYVCRTSDNRCLNEDLIREGYGLTYRRFDFKHRDKYLALEEEAQENARGFWK